MHSRCGVVAVQASSETKSLAAIAVLAADTPFQMLPVLCNRPLKDYKKAWANTEKVENLLSVFAHA